MVPWDPQQGEYGARSRRLAAYRCRAKRMGTWANASCPRRPCTSTATGEE